LEDRQLLDAKSQVLFHPEAILRLDYPQVSSGASDPVQVGAQPDTPTNVPVNDPAEDGNNASDYHSETTVLAAGNNTIISAFNDSTFEFTGNGFLTGVGVSSDGGQSFVDQGRLPSTPAGDAGDPVLARDAVTGRIYLGTLAFHDVTQLYVFHSDDNGNTFSQPVNGAPGVGYADKEWIAVDNTGGPGQSNVYLIVRDFGGGNGIYMFRSTDQGATFGNRSLIASGSSFNVQGAWVTVGPDGTVYAFWYAASTPNSIMMRKSTDLGLTFGAPVLVANLRTNGTNGDLGMHFRTNAFPQAVVNPVNNDIYVTFDDKGTGSDRADVFFTESTDGGATWSTPTKINDDTTTNDQWNPALAVTPNGADVGVFWYDRRNDPNNQLIDRFGAIGNVSGHTVTFAPNMQITDQSFPEEFGHVGGIVSNYMGDYDQAVATNNFFYLTWEDNRRPSLGHPGQAQDVRFAEIPLAVSGGAVIGATPRGTLTGAVDHIRFTFDESMRPHSFDKITAIPSFTDPSGNQIPITAVTPVPGTNNTQFDVSFPAQGLAGTYTMVVGPKIRDRFGRWMDQDGDGYGHHADAEDSYTATFTILGPSVTGVSPTGNNHPPGSIQSVRFTFNEPIVPATFTPAKVDSFVDPNGNQIPIIDVQPVPNTNNTQFDVTFAPLGLAGSYTMVIGRDIEDAAGNQLSQAYTTGFGIFGPSVTGVSPTGNNNLPGSVHAVRFTFNEPIVPATFTPAKVDSFVDPHGNQIPIIDVQPVPNTNNTQFDVTFAPLGVAGSYTMVIGPDIEDAYGNQLPQAYSTGFGIAAPTITSFVRNGSPTDPATNVRVTFNEPMDPNTFDPSQVTRFTDPNGNPITVNSVTPVSGSNNTQFDIAFDPQATVGSYTMTIGPNIMDPYGNPMTAAFTGMFIYTDEIIVNGSFEMQFTGWSAGSGWIITGPGHEDANAAGSGAVGSTTPLSQVITTVAGQQYTFSFWYSRVDGTPAEIHAFFGGQDVYDEVNTPAHDYQFHTFTVTATSTSTTILFMGRNDPSYDLLDDVSVRPFHGPSAAAQVSSGSAALLRGTALVPLAREQAPATTAPSQQTGVSAQLQITPPSSAIDQAFLFAPADATLAVAAGLHPHQAAAGVDWSDPWAALSIDNTLLL
jgi:hypothetical protein